MSENGRSYYGRPIIKEPVWKSEIPLYFFFGGLAGAADTLALAARLADNDRLRNTALYTATAAGSVSPYLLIKDLGRPLRFYNMLRVFKVTSPMSVGTWILSLEGAATGIAAGCRLFGVLPRVRAVAQVVAGVVGPAQATYTGALVADSVVPVWHEGRRELPLVFAASSAASAGGATAALTPPRAAGPARRLALLGGVCALLAKQVMEKRMGKFIADPYHTGRAGTYSRLSTGATLAGTALMALSGRRRAGAVTAGALLLAGSLCERFAVFHAGRISAADPHYTSIPQRERLRS